METAAAAQTLDSLNGQFGRAGLLAFTANSFGLIAAEITTELCRGRVYLQGAHVTEYQPRGQGPLIWTSSASLYRPGRAIRGGIPVCWPWFGNHPTDSTKPAHGFARTTLWELVAAEHNINGETILTLALSDNQQSRVLWPYSFNLTLTISFGASLRLQLTMENRSPAAVSISCALHSYFRVADWQTCRIHGLDGVDYLDKVEGSARKAQTGILALEQETDRIYLLPDAVCRLESPETRRTILIRQQGSSATVVWNPGPVKVAAMADMSGEEYRKMICVESVIAPQLPIILPPGAAHVLATEIV